jgi:hypothetical protein
MGGGNKYGVPIVLYSIKILHVAEPVTRLHAACALGHHGLRTG